MSGSSFPSGAQVKTSRTIEPQLNVVRDSYDRVTYGIYALALAASISFWFIAIRAPLWEDETGSFWQISEGFSKIWSRQFVSLSFPAYSYILWFWTRIFGTSEVALRFLSAFAMLGAAYLLYLIALEMFDREMATIAVIIFSLHPTVIFEAIDVRPYAFALLVTNAAILMLVRLRNSNSTLLAGLLGVCAAFILYFRYLSAVILPAFLLCFVFLKIRDRKVLFRQLAAILIGFALAIVPLVPGIKLLFQTSGTHVAEQSANVAEFFWLLASGWWLIPAVLVTFLVVAVRPRSHEHFHHPRWQKVLCVSLGLIPAFLLFGVSATTSTKVFAARHSLGAVPGISLCWAMAVAHFRPRAMRLVFCAAFVVFTAGYCIISPSAKVHRGSWKYALEAAERNAVTDNAPVMICSGFVESNYATMPIDSPKVSPFFAQLSYYKLSVPVVPLPLSFNSETVRVGSLFLREAKQKHERFLAVAHLSSSETLEWIESNTADTHTFRKLGIFDEFEVLEFVPRDGASLQIH